MKTTYKVLCKILILATFLSLAACSGTATAQPSPTAQPTTPAEIRLTDGLERSIVLKSPAQRIVSLAPSNSEILFAVGAGGQVVGRDAYSDYPEEIKNVTDIGGGFGELNTEAILSLKPDLVLASSLTAPEQIKALEDLGLVVFALANPDNIEGMYENLQIVAKLTGHEQEAEKSVASLKERVTALDQKLAGVTQRPLVFYEIDGTDPNAVWTPGPNTFVARLIDRAGGKNLGDSLEGDWVKISLEQLIAQQPEMVLIGDYLWGGVTAEDIAARSGWEALEAVKSGRLYPFDDNLVSRPGPRLVDGLEALAKLFHPELFQ